MSDVLLIQQAYPDTPVNEMLKLTCAHHARYCKTHGIEYRHMIDNPFPQYDLPAGNWTRVELLRKALADYKQVIWLDVDTLIVDIKSDLRNAIQPGKIGVCWHRIPQLHHWNIGAMYIDSSIATRKFFEHWLAGYPPPGDGWLEQGVFNRLARESDLVVTLSDRWNATIDVSMVPDAVVLGFHGQGDPERRLNMMRAAMQKLFPDQKASMQGTA